MGCASKRGVRGGSMKAFLLGVLIIALLDYANVMDAASIIVLFQSLAQATLTWVASL